MQEETLSKDTFHVHQVMEMMHSENRPLTVLELTELIIQKFGPVATFQSCSMSGMNPAQVIEFLLGRQKISECEPGKYTLNSQHTCNH